MNIDLPTAFESLLYLQFRTIISTQTHHKEKPDLVIQISVGVWRLLKNDNGCTSSLNDWVTMETQEGEDEISSNDIMAGLFRADMLSQSATGQVASIFIRGRNPIHARYSLTDSSLSQMPPDIYVYCLILPSEALIRSRESSISIQTSCCEEKRDKVS